MRLWRRSAATLAAILLTALGGAARADAASLCQPSTAGPWEYQASLNPFMHDPVPTPPRPPTPGGPPPPPPVSTSGGATGAAREALGAQFSGRWLNSTVQGWVVGLAPGPLDAAAARAAIVARLRTRFAESDVAYLDSRLHLDPQLYGEDELQATRDALEATLRSDPGAAPVGSSVGCRLSDARRIELTVYSYGATPEQVERVLAIVVPYGDKVRVEVSSSPPPAPAIGLPVLPAPRPQPVAFAQHVTMPISRRCVRARQLRVRARASQPPVQALSVRVGGRSRTISGRRLAKPLTVDLRGRRTRVIVTVRLADGRVGTQTVTYIRCR